MEVLSEVVTCLQNAEYLRPIFAAHHDTDREKSGWDHLPPTAQWIILTVSAVDGLTITSEPPTSLHFFLNKCMQHEGDSNLTAR